MCMYDVLECIFLLRLIKTKQALLYVILFFFNPHAFGNSGEKTNSKRKTFQLPESADKDDCQENIHEPPGLSSGLCRYGRG